MPEPGISLCPFAQMNISEIFSVKQRYGVSLCSYVLLADMLVNLFLFIDGKEAE